MARYIVSRRLAGQPDTPLASAAKPTFGEGGQEFFTAMSGKLKAFADVRPKAGPGTRRDAVVIDTDPADLAAKQPELTGNAIVEPELPRHPALFSPSVNLAAEPIPAGIGAAVDVIVRSNGAPVSAAVVTMLLQNARTGQTTSVVRTTEADGTTSLPYNARIWVPTVAIVTPVSGVWSWWVQNPQSQVALELPPLPQTGPLGWWHEYLGMAGFSETRGEGIRIGIADTGTGPHQYLEHVRSVGAFVNGSYDKTAQAGADTGQHGTHVAGIIGARPTAGSRDFSGIASGAEVLSARVYPGGGPPGQTEGNANNLDIANAIDELSSRECDLINLSLGGAEPSDVESDAIAGAVEHGCLVICSAGNGSGAPILYPAADPRAVAVSAIGLFGAVPMGSLDSMSLPQQADHYAGGGLYLASFSNVGLEMKCTGPGVGIVSTVPGTNGAPYAAMSGTSMAAPAVTAALATLLSHDAGYRNLPRNAQRAQRAWTVLVSTLRSLGLNQQYQGFGMGTAWPV